MSSQQRLSPKPRAEHFRTGNYVAHVNCKKGAKGKRFRHSGKKSNKALPLSHYFKLLEFGGLKGILTGRVRFQQKLIDLRRLINSKVAALITM